MVTKKNIVQKARELERLIDQHFTDVDHWNRTVMPGDAIDCDPHGTLQQLAQHLEVFVMRHTAGEHRIINVESNVIYENEEHQTKDSTTECGCK